jgi:hypothetical protein
MKSMCRNIRPYPSIMVTIPVRSAKFPARLEKIPCVSAKNSLPRIVGNLPQCPGIALRIDAETAATLKIRCEFPCSREFRGAGAYSGFR